ncbi:MAG: mevalonate kinase [Actinobacteria bacterium]|nr:mevalonate kinase [Actinomycetota bacterium]
MKAIAPGKIIISGEHSVVYGKPALVMAVDRYAQATITDQHNREVSFDLLDFNTSSSLTLNALRELKYHLIKNYHKFLDGELGIRQVLKKPFELFDFLFITFLDTLQVKLERGVNIKLQSNIPIGCGMGSSAATILSVLRGVSEYFNMDLLPEKYYNIGLEAEKLQHGRSSGVDPYVSLHGGFLRFQEDEATELPLPELPMVLVNTGVPETSTGECVAHVSAKFGTSKIWDDFEWVTNEIQEVLVNGNIAELKKLVQKNNRLLEQIGVVPERIRSFIRDIESYGGAAKIAGAGAVAGEKGGIVSIFAQDAPVDVCKKYGFEIIPVKGEALGARVV